MPKNGIKSTAEKLERSRLLKETIKKVLLEPTMQHFKDDTEIRIENMKVATVPDFGIQMNLKTIFDEMSSEDRKNRPATIKSNWSLVYDCIRLYPRFERLIKYIKDCQENK